MRYQMRTAMWAIPAAHSHQHIPPRTSPIDPRIVRLAETMGRPAVDVESEIHSVIAFRFAKHGQFLPIDLAVKYHGEAQAFYDAFKLEREWPANEEICQSIRCQVCVGLQTEKPIMQPRIAKESRAV